MSIKRAIAMGYWLVGAIVLILGLYWKQSASAEFQHVFLGVVLFLLTFPSGLFVAFLWGVLVGPDSASNNVLDIAFVLVVLTAGYLQWLAILWLIRRFRARDREKRAIDGPKGSGSFGDA